ncbi:DUF4158 domain-containing protein, partial [Nocardia seriolae]
MATRVFADEELQRLREFPEISREELFRYFTLSPADLAFVAPQGRGANVRLGLAVILCSLPWLGFVPDKVATAPPVAVARLAEQLNVDAAQLRSYSHRPQTRSEHVRLVAQYLGWRPAGAVELKELDEFLLARAMEHDSPTLLFRLACEYLISARVIRPDPVTLVERVAHARNQAQAETYDRLAHELTPQRCQELDALLVVDPSLGMSRLTWLSTGPVEASAAAVKAEIDKLGFLRGLGADTLDISVLPAERRRRRFLATMGRRLTGQALERRDPQRRYPILLTLLAQSATDVLDEVVQLFDQAISAKFSTAERRMRDELAERGKSGEDRQALLDDLLSIITDLQIADEEIGGLIRGEKIGWERLRAAIAQAKPRLPRDHGHLAALAASYSYLRQFTPAVLSSVRFAGGTAATELLIALNMLRELNATGGRKVFDDAPTGFVPTKWCGYLDEARKSGSATAYRHYWELCVLLGLRDGLRRTIYAVKYLSDPDYRRKISRQLNKGESLHALRRDLLYAHEGMIRARHLESQTEQAWCLTLATNAVIAWTAEYYGLAVEQMRREGRRIDDEVLAHVSPAHSENINFFGAIEVDIDAELAQLGPTGYRPLL